MKVLGQIKNFELKSTYNGFNTEIIQRFRPKGARGFISYDLVNFYYPFVGIHSKC
jgi:hypothetical protein